MNASAQPLNGPPKLFQALGAGFQIVANHAWLLLFPVVIDLFLWFGPHFRVKTLFTPALENLYNMPGFGLSNPALQTAMKEVYGLFLDHFNLASLLSTMPVGIPTLMSGLQPITTPLGAPILQEVGNLTQLFSGMLLFILVGYAGGTLFFSAIAQLIAGEKGRIGLSGFFKGYSQALLLALMMLLVLFVLMIPMFLLTFVLLLIAPNLAQFVVLFGFLGLIWILIPLVFSPHGIFLLSMNVFQAMYASMRTVRRIFPGVMMFLITAFVFMQGMGVIWRIAPATSWLTVGGIFGNAFIVTGLLAASFVYYRGATNWINQPQV